MMRALSCAAVLISCLAPAWAAKRTPPHPLTIIYRFDGVTSQIAFRAMQEEALRLLRSSSILPEWRGNRDVSSSERFETLVVVSFNGQCRTGTDIPRVEDQLPLGRTRLIDGRVQPFIEIECERVRASLHAAERMTQNLNTDAALGRALARVLSHELYHVLARTTEHTRTGIAKPSLSGADLVSAYLAFAPADLDRMTSPQEDSSVRISSRLPKFIQ